MQQSKDDFFQTWGFPSEVKASIPAHSFEVYPAPSAPSAYKSGRPRYICSFATGINVNYLNLVSTSDYRLKHDICSSAPEESLSRITALRPVTYAWEDESHGEGFIAHELAEIVPGAVFGEKDAVDARDGKPVYQKIDVTKLIPHLVGAIQELTRRLAVLEAGSTSAK